MKKTFLNHPVKALALAFGLFSTAVFGADAPLKIGTTAAFAIPLETAVAEAGVAHFSASTAIDFSQYELDEPIQYVKSNAIQSATKNLQNNDWTRRKLLEQHALGGRYITLVGSPEHVADELESWISETGLDGFNLTRIVTPESYVDFIDLVIPELQKRGSYKTAYETGTLREKVFQGTARLPEQHTGSTYRPLPH